MHAMSSRHPHHHFTQQQHPPSTPPPSSPYQPYPPNAELLSPTASHTYVQNRSSSSCTSSTVTPNGPHLSSTRPRSPIFQTPASSTMPRPNSPAPPPSSATGHARDVVPAPSSTHSPPEDVVMTSTINFTRDHRDRPIINQYLIGHRVGKGQHGEVFKGYDMRRGNMVVVRIFFSDLSRRACSYRLAWTLTECAFVTGNQNMRAEELKGSKGRTTSPAESRPYPTFCCWRRLRRC